MSRGQTNIKAVVIAPKSAVKLLLVAEQDFTRDGIEALLRNENRILVVGDAADDRTAMCMVIETQPDVAVLDLDAPSKDRCRLGKYLRAIGLHTNVIVLTAEDNGSRPSSTGWHEFGVSMCLPKTVLGGELVSAIYEAACVRPLDSTQLRPDEVSTPDYRKPHSWGMSASTGLTTREAEVLGKIAQGLRNHEISEALGISPKTVETHVRHILVKLGARSRAQAVMTGVRDGWL